MPFTLAPSPPRSAVTAPAIRQLPNGLTIIAEQMPTAAVNLDLWLPVGSLVETDAINGMAHFLEHMIFKGTPLIQSGEFERLIEERGALTNAATSQDYTHYYITTAPKDFADLAPLQVELVINSSIAEDAFERERPVILEEIRRAEDNPRRRMFQRSMELSFERLPYRRPVLGPTAVIEQLTAEQMRAFHSGWYQPHRMTAVAVGDLPVSQLMDIVETSFEQALARRQQSLTTATIPDATPLRIPETPFQTIKRIACVDETLQQARLMMGWRVPGFNQLADTYALDVVASILGQGRTARLVHDLRDVHKLVHSISVSNITYSHQGVFYISAMLAADQLATVEAAIVQHLQRLHEDPITATELRRVQTQVANRYIFGSETPSDRAGLYGYYHAMTGDIRHALEYPAMIQAMDAAAVQAAVQQYLPTTAYGVLTLRPAG
jgi:zinc protease